LRDAGKDTEAEALAKANGLDKGFKHRPKATDAQLKSMTAIKAAIDANDFVAFTTAISGTPAAGKVDQATFSEIVNVQSLRKQAESAEKTFATNHKDLMMLIGPAGDRPGMGGQAMKGRTSKQISHLYNLLKTTILIRQLAEVGGFCNYCKYLV
jgi:hypothetical protein